MSQQLADFLASNWFVFLFAWGVSSACSLGIAMDKKKNPKEFSRFEHYLAVVFDTASNIFSAAFFYSLAVIFFRWKGWA